MTPHDRFHATMRSPQYRKDHERAEKESIRRFDSLSRQAKKQFSDDTKNWVNLPLQRLSRKWKVTGPPIFEGEIVTAGRLVRVSNHEILNEISRRRRMFDNSVVVDGLDKRRRVLNLRVQVDLAERVTQVLEAVEAEVVFWRGIMKIRNTTRDKSSSFDKWEVWGKRENGKTYKEIAVEMNSGEPEERQNIESLIKQVSRADKIARQMINAVSNPNRFSASNQPSVSRRTLKPTSIRPCRKK